MSIMTQEIFLKIINGFSLGQGILVIGDIGIDKYTAGNVMRISPEAPVPILEVTKEWQTLGLAANISYNLKVLGVESILCGVLGDDKRASEFEALLEEKKLKTWGLVREKNRKTIFKERIVTNTQQIVRIDYESKKNISKKVQDSLLERIKDFYSGHDAIILEDYGKGCITKDIIAEVLRLSKENNKLVAVDPSRFTPAIFYKGVGLLKPNLLESQILVDNLGYKETDVMKISEILIEKLELKKLCITLGADGMALVDTEVSNKCMIIPTVAKNVYDVSGAGDTSIGLLVAGLLTGASLVEAAWVANCGAGVVVGKKGTATVAVDELIDFCENLLKKDCQ